VIFERLAPYVTYFSNVSRATPKKALFTQKEEGAWLCQLRGAGFCGVYFVEIVETDRYYEVTLYRITEIERERNDWIEPVELCTRA
jgi:hypothetical protein